MKKTRFALSLGLSLTLGGCGLAGDDGASEPPPDTVAPRLLNSNISPAPGTQLASSQLDSIVFVIPFDESLDPTSVEQGISLTQGGAPVDAAITFDSNANVARVDPVGTLDYNATYVLNISPAIADLAGNSLTLTRILQLTYSTPRLLNLTVRSASLQAGTSVTITDGESGNTLTLDSSNAAAGALLLQDYPENSPYRLSLTASTGEQFCAFAQDQGTLTNSATVDLHCSAVTPYYPVNGADWTDFVTAGSDQACTLGADAAYTDCEHAGAMRAFRTTAASDCANVTAADALGAFDWACAADGSAIVVYSTGLKADKRLADLISANTWKLNSLTVDINGAQTTTQQGVWWRTPLRDARLAARSNVYLDQPGTVYTVTSSQSNRYYLVSASNVALVIARKATLSALNRTPVSILAGNHLGWFEGTLNAGGGEYGIGVGSGSGHVLRHLTVTGALNAGVSVTNGRANRLEYVTAYGNPGSGVAINAGAGNLIHDLTLDSNGGDGLYLRSGPNTVHHVTAANNGGHGVTLDVAEDTAVNRVASNNNGGAGVALLSSVNNVLTGITAVANQGAGVLLTGGSALDYSGNNVLVAVTAAANEGAGVEISATAGATTNTANQLHGIATSANGGPGLLLSHVDGNAVSDLAAAGNGGAAGVALVQTTANPFSGQLLGACTSDGGEACPAALDDSVTDITSSFAGLVSGDSVNVSDDSTPLYYSYIDDWTGFENTFRGWLGSVDINDASHGACDDAISSQCQIHDWSLASTDTVLRGALAQPTGDDTHTIAWAGASAGSATFLDNAYEVLNDGLGNDNGLCESGETCVYTPNLGSYQGHGELAAVTFTAGALTAVDLRQYAANGR